MFTTKIFLGKVKVLQNHSEKQVSRKTSIREGSTEKFKRFKHHSRSFWGILLDIVLVLKL